MNRLVYYYEKNTFRLKISQFFRLDSHVTELSTDPVFSIYCKFQLQPYELRVKMHVSRKNTVKPLQKQ